MHHTGEQFVSFLRRRPPAQPRESYVIRDNVSSRRTERVVNFLNAHREVRLHFMPIYLPWLNQAEDRFSRIQRNIIVRWIFLRRTWIAHTDDFDPRAQQKSAAPT
ncbi:transposase [Paraburkholderia phenoliruptrix]|uniref:transposase n=1 Tax=Paraburkholderia phenoliruptrix TaxID=252970 RepID=UPI002869C477|nr:transposase [Paraburkholderia phenoliruptrix]WMY11010.1 transposase [Paraburkholderia phenoliruptrix]